MFLLLVRVNSLVVEHDTITDALKRDQTDEELSMMQIELHSECSTIESQLKNEAQWAGKYVTGCVGRSSQLALDEALTPRTNADRTRMFPNRNTDAHHPRDVQIRHEPSTRSSALCKLARVVDKVS